MIEQHDIVNRFYNYQFLITSSLNKPVEHTFNKFLLYHGILLAIWFLCLSTKVCKELMNVMIETIINCFIDIHIDRELLNYLSFISENTALCYVLCMRVLSCFSALVKSKYLPTHSKVKVYHNNYFIYVHIVQNPKCTMKSRLNVWRQIEVLLCHLASTNMFCNPRNKPNFLLCGEHKVLVLDYIKMTG